MNDLHNEQWNTYLETPRYASKPVKLDKIMSERLHAFIKAKRIRRFHFNIVEATEL